MRDMPDGCVDLIYTDPPYKGHWGKGGGAFGNRAYFKHVQDGVGSREDFDILPYLNELPRLCRPFCGYFWTSQKLLHTFFDFAEERGFLFDLLVWGKTNPVPTKNNKYLPDTEYCVYLHESGAYFSNDEKFPYYRKCMITQVNKSEYGHPTEKPTEICRPGILISSKPNDLILDPFLGSGTTAVACIETGRRFIGIEISPEYCAIAEKRIAGARSKTKLDLVMA